MHHLRYFFIDEMVLAKIYPYTKFKISSFIYSKFTEGVLKFENSAMDLTMPPFWSLKSITLTNDLRQLIINLLIFC